MKNVTNFQIAKVQPQGVGYDLIGIINAIIIVKIMLVNGDTTATSERSFSIASRIKTWLNNDTREI